MSLTDWLAQGLLKRHSSSREEIRELLALADRDLQQCQVEDLTPDWRLAIAYNAALQCATSALAAAGYRAERTAHHYRVIHSLAFTIGWNGKEISLFDYFRRKRHTAGYERADSVSAQECTEMLRIAQRLRSEVEKWLRANHPGLL